MDALHGEGEQFVGSRAELPSLPAYDSSRLLVEHSKMFAVAVAVLAVVVTFVLWKLVRSREDETVRNMQPGADRLLTGGRFNQPVLGGIRRPLPEAYLSEQHHECASHDEVSKTNFRSEHDSSDNLSEEEDTTFEKNTDAKNKRAEVAEHAEENAPKGSDEKNCSDAGGKKKTEEIDLIASLGKLHGKLATAQLHARTNKLEKEMTKEQLEEERQIRNQQLETIFEMMRSDTEKFGVQDKSQLLEQMKLYSV